MMGQDQGKPQITFLTYNVWFDKLNFDYRAQQIIKSIQTLSPDFVCLQEVTQQFIKHLNDNSVIQKTYHKTNNKIDGYGILILQKIPPKQIREVPFDTMQGRSLLYTVSRINGQDIVVGTSHLESYAQSFRIREKQLRRAYEELKDYKNVILMGDFNLELEVDEKSISPEYQDLWPIFHQDIGHTWFMGKHSHRLDRVIVKKGLFKQPYYQGDD